MFQLDQAAEVVLAVAAARLHRSPRAACLHPVQTHPERQLSDSALVQDQETLDLLRSAPRQTANARVSKWETL